MRVCKKCGEEKCLETEFRPHGHVPGFRHTCRVCERKAQESYACRHPEIMAARARAWSKNNPEKRNATKRAYYARDPERHKRTARKSLYGITPEQFSLLLENQGGGCATCGGTSRLSVDHDHRTGQVRGILCGRCNSILGFAKDSGETLAKLIFYLQGLRSWQSR